MSIMGIANGVRTICWRKDHTGLKEPVIVTISAVRPLAVGSAGVTHGMHLAAQAKAGQAHVRGQRFGKAEKLTRVIPEVGFAEVPGPGLPPPPSPELLKTMGRRARGSKPDAWGRGAEAGVSPASPGKSGTVG
jgi:hypothetical protein